LPIFARIQQTGGIAAAEMFRVFNMGIGLVAIVPAERLQDARRVAPEAIVIGALAPRGGGDAVRLRGIAG
jgi:phosphoribosylformylglycinamidine cyclo-ligase